MVRGDWTRRLLGSMVVLAVTSAVAHAADDRARKKAPPPADVQSQYKLDLSTSLSPSHAPAPPPGASTLAEERKLPFLGLKLSTPLGN